MRIDLNCPHRDKEEAKAAGARWDPARQVWYVVDPPDLMRFEKWLNISKKDKEWIKKHKAPA
jgi:hypothetical protein